MTGEGRKSRNERLLTTSSGTYGSSSVDFVVLVRRLYKQSKAYADSCDGNCSPYALCGIPMLMTALRCLMIEYESLPPADRSSLKILTKPNDFMKMLEHYRVSDPLLREARLLSEIRNEIVHPAHLPAGTSDNWPDYLRELKNTGLLQSTGEADGDYVFFSQLSSHKLLAWASRVTRDIAECIVHSNLSKAGRAEGFLASYNSIDVANGL